MDLLRHFTIFALLISVLAYGLSSCDDDPVRAGSTDGDTDADTDTDVDGDSDSDADAVGEGIPMMPSTDGWIEDQDNPLGMQGAWYSFASEGSTITPKEGDQFVNDGIKLHTEGTAAQVMNEDYSTYYGAAIGFDVCAPDDEERTSQGLDRDFKYTLGNCPYNENLASVFQGISFNVDGTWESSELRVTFREQNRDESAYVEVLSAGPVTALASDAQVFYSPSKPGTDVSKIESIHFHIPTNTTSATPFKFDISNVKIIASAK